jgi:hypothetical protein
LIACLPLIVTPAQCVYRILSAICQKQEFQRDFASMALASHATVFMARFDEMRATGDLPRLDAPGTLFRHVAADTRGAAQEPAAQQAFRFLVIGLHSDEGSAIQFMDRGCEVAPWFADAVETWAAVVRPFRHMGDCNYLDQAKPGPLFASVDDAPDPGAPIVIITTVGWVLGPDLDMNRIAEFGKGASGVRVSMTGTPGLYSQESYFFPGAIQHDPLTVTSWRDASSARNFAYGPGIHRIQLQRLHEQKLADRTSFTRCRIVRARGSWHGVCPVANK